MRRAPTVVDFANAFIRKARSDWTICPRVDCNRFRANLRPKGGRRGGLQATLRRLSRTDESKGSSPFCAQPDACGAHPRSVSDWIVRMRECSIARFVRRVSSRAGGGAGGEGSLRLVQRNESRCTALRGASPCSVRHLSPARNAAPAWDARAAVRLLRHPVRAVAGLRVDRRRPGGDASVSDDGSHLETQIVNAAK